MTQPLVGKQILVVEDESVFRSLVDPWFSFSGVTTAVTGDRFEALDLFGHFRPDLVIRNLAIPRMNGLGLTEYLRNRSDQAPILVISATENMLDITKVLRFNVDDVLLKPVKNLDRLRETISTCLYPNMFNLRVEEEERLFCDWDTMVDDPAAATKSLRKLQSPVSQVTSHYRVNYRQLVTADQPRLVLDVAPPSGHDLAFYCLDAMRIGDNGVLTALLLRALFNGLLQKQLTQQNQRLLELGALLKQVNHLSRQVNLPGQFPLLVRCYHSGLKNLVLVSARLNAALNTGSHQVRISSDVPLGTLGNTYLNQPNQHCELRQCRV